MTTPVMTPMAKLWVTSVAITSGKAAAQTLQRRIRVSIALKTLSVAAKFPACACVQAAR